ncbi:MAG: hypothetical protein H3C48_19025 [Chitinophagaceae bacterium]|nr:hypothetical protein [Chitinophagaceae bacterium]
MKKLNQQATRIFCAILKKLGGKDYLQLQAKGFAPLSVKKMQENIITPAGNATAYSLSHSYEQNGDLMRNPEMVFLVVDNRNGKTDYMQIGIYPQTYQDDQEGLFEESIRVENGKVTTCIKLWQEGHCRFATTWLQNIKALGFLNKCKR